MGTVQENTRRHKSLKNKTEKAVSKAMRENAEEALTELQNCQYGMFRLVKGLKTDSKQVEGGSDGNLCFSEKERGNVLKDYMERIMSEENDTDHNVDGDVEDGPVDCISREELQQALNEMKTGKDPGPSEVSIELIAADRGVGIQAMAEICQRGLDEFGMPVEWALSIVVLFFKRKGDIKNCSCYRA